MIAAIELGKEYAQVCVKTDSMRDAESVTYVAGTEHYRIPIEGDLEKSEDLQEIFRKLWKMLSPYGNKDSLEYLMFCLEENVKELRSKLLDVVEIYNISTEKVRFLDKKECFCAYVFHQGGDLLARNSLVIENVQGRKDKLLLHKHAKTVPVVANVKDFSSDSLESVFTDHGISSVFLVGDDFEEEWMQKNLKLLKTGRRVFLGKNLYVKGAVYRGMELKEGSSDYLYLGAEKVCCNIAMKGEKDFFVIVEGGKNWYESNVTIDVLLLEDPSLEFAIVPINGQEKKTVVVHLNNLPVRPNRTTRLRISITFENPTYAKLVIKDLGFGELFPQSDMIFEGELQWVQ